MSNNTRSCRSACFLGPSAEACVSPSRRTRSSSILLNGITWDEVASRANGNGNGVVCIECNSRARTENGVNNDFSLLRKLTCHAILRDWMTSRPSLKSSRRLELLIVYQRRLGGLVPSMSGIIGRTSGAFDNFDSPALQTLEEASLS